MTLGLFGGVEGPDGKNQNDDKELCCWVAMATFRRLHSITMQCLKETW